MHLNEYQHAASRFALYPEAGTGSLMALSYTALGLVGEGGEYSEKVKKYIRDGVFDKELAAKELGDVLWYLSEAARNLGMQLEDIAYMNFQKLSARKAAGTLQGSGDER